jgi:hypothetical protein
MTWNNFKITMNNLWIGLGIGMLLPILGFYISKFFKYPQGDYNDYWNLLIGNTIYTSDILTLSLIPNMLLFYFFYFQWKTDKAARGLVFSTLIWIGLLFIIS